jgi:hypothetical protein
MQIDMSTTTLVMLVIAVPLALFFAVRMKKVSSFRAKCQVAFDDIFGQQRPPPIFDIRFMAYGYILFTVTFRSNADLSRAEEQGLTKVFRDLISRIYAGKCLERKGVRP